MTTKLSSDLAIILRFIREGLGVSQAKLGELSGVSPNLINDYEQGRKPLKRERLEYLLSFMGIPPERIDENLGYLEDNRASARAPYGSRPFLSGSEQRIEAVAVQVGSLATGFARGILSLLSVEAEGLEARQKAGALWTRLQRRSVQDRIALIEDSKKFRTWALCERVAAESIEAAASDAGEALKLAELALRIAELCPGSEAWRSRLEGYALAHVANANRVGGNMPPARVAMIRGKKLWDAGAAADPGLLNEARVLHIEANICCVDQRFTEARRLLSEAMRLDHPGMAAPLLYTEARVFEGMGDLRQAAVALEKASFLVNAKREPRLALSISFQLLVNLCLDGRPAEAKPKLRDIRTAAEQQNKELDLLRVVWLEGMVASGLGQNDEAKSRLEQVCRELAQREIAYDCALATLELAAVLLSENRSGEVCSLAGNLVWIFRSQQVHGSALAALSLFSESAKRQTATVDFTRRVLRFLYRAQHNPELRLEDEAGAEQLAAPSAPADRP